MPMIPPFFLVQSPFSMQFLHPAWRSGPPPLSPGVFRAPHLWGLRDVAPRPHKFPGVHLFCYFGKIGLDWLGKKCNKLRFYYQMWGKPVEFPTKNLPVLKLLWQSRKRALVLDCHLLEWSSTLEGPNTRPTRVLARQWHEWRCRFGGRIIVTSHWQVSRNLQLYPEYIRTAAQHMSTSSPSTPIIEFKNGVNLNAKRQSVILRNMQGNMRIPPKTHKKRGKHQVQPNIHIVTLLFCVHAIQGYIQTHSPRIPEFSSPVWRPSGLARPVCRGLDFRRHRLSLFSITMNKPYSIHLCTHTYIYIGAWYTLG